MNDLISIFLNNTFTTSDIKRRLLILKAFIYSKFFGSSFNQADFEPNDIGWLQGLGLPAGGEFFKGFTQTNSTMQLEKLEEALKKIPVLIVYIPFEMPEAESQQLGTWLKTNIGPSVIFETRIDPYLIGGSALSWKGIYKDYSLRQTLSERRSEILGTFKEFING